MTETKNYFVELSKLNLNKYLETKNNLDYLPWAVAWEELKKVYPNAKKIDYPQIMDEFGNTRFWHDDGKTGWVEVGVEIEGHEEKLTLPIMDHRNQAIPAEAIKSTEANKAYMRCLVKVLALHGIGLYVYRKDDIPASVKEIDELQKECVELIQKKAALGESTKKLVAAICTGTDSTANGDPRLIDDVDTLKDLKKKLLAVRKAPTPTKKSAE